MTAGARAPGTFGSVRYGARAALAIASDPREGVERVVEKLAETREGPPPRYPAIAEWEEPLHVGLSLPWPCDEGRDFAEVWAGTMRSLADAGLGTGRGAFGGWDDGDPGLARAAWCLARHLSPATVVETGVARGVTTRVVLEAFMLNRAGRLFSIDLPPLLERDLSRQTGTAVTADLRGRWTLIEGSSRRRLRPLLDAVGPIDMFIHDSMHTERNMLFELDLAWRALRPGGALLIDDVHRNAAFARCAQSFRGSLALVCASDDGRGMFGVIAKPGRSEPR